jgi:glutaminyl-peptide cyclotransferase
MLAGSLFVRRVATRFLWALPIACFATAAAADSGPLWEKFSGTKALGYVQSLVDLGPRPAGSEALEKSRSYIEKQLQSEGWKTSRQSFSAQTPRGLITFINLIATFADRPTPDFLLCSHYDTKTFDTIQFVGANDGGSSTGLLLELGRVLAQEPAKARRVELVFFDGEEAFEKFTDTDGLYGSRFFAKDLAGKKFKGGILFDMIGDSSLDVTLPPDSPRPLARGIFEAAEKLKVRDHFTYFSGQILDDHTPLNAAGVPTIDVIDFDFPWWHTAGDTMDKISAESLQIVGQVALRYLAEDALK